MNFLKHKVLFRCDAADIPEVGTGHLYRCLTIAKILQKKFKLQSKDIAFLIKSKNKFKKSIQILNFYKFKIIKIKNSKLKPYSFDEIKYFTNNKANLLIIDRLGKINNKFYKRIKDSFKKKIIIDDSSEVRKHFDLSLNPLIHNVKKFKNSNIGFKHLILPAFTLKKNFKVKVSNIFILFGGYDANNITLKIVKILINLPIRLNLIIHNSFKKKIEKTYPQKKIFFFDNSDYLKLLKSSNIAITAGGIGLFDSIYYNKKIICIPQYKHQEINAKKISVKKAINLIKLKDKNFKRSLIRTFIKVYENRKIKRKVKVIQNRIINTTMLKKTLKLITNLYDQSRS